MRFCTVACLSLLLSVGAAEAKPSEVQAIPVEAVVWFSPSSVRAEGRRHLLYELHLTNFGKHDLQLARVDVSDPATGKVLQSVTGNALVSAIYVPGVPQAKDRVSPVGKAGQFQHRDVCDSRWRLGRLHVGGLR